MSNKNNSLISRFKKGFAASLGLMFGLICFGIIAYAFTTWAPGLVPQADPANGNVQLASCPPPSCPTGYHFDATTNACVADAVTRECKHSGSSFSWGYWAVHRNGDIAATWPGIGMVCGAGYADYVALCKPCYFTEKICGGYKYTRGEIDPDRTDGGWVWYYICREPVAN